MATEEVLLGLFCLVDERLGDRPKQPQARWWPSELVTIGVLFAVKGSAFRSFDRGLDRDDAALVGGLPERTRRLRAWRTHQRATEPFLADPTCFPGIDPSGIERLHPWRDGRRPRQVGKQGDRNHRWIVGRTGCWLVTCRGAVVAWDWKTATTADQRFAPVAAPFDGLTSTLADVGFAAVHRPATVKLCARGEGNERMLIEPVRSLVHRVCHLKDRWHRTRPSLHMHLAYVTAVFKALLALTHRLDPLGSDHAWPHLAQSTL